MRLVWHRVLTGETCPSILRGDESPGNVDVSKVANSRKSIARYLGKYIAKDFETSTSVDSDALRSAETLRIEKRYFVSKGLPKPTLKKFRLPSCPGDEAFVLRNALAQARWRVQRYFETVVNGRRLIWMEVRRVSAAARPRAVSLAATFDGAGASSYS
jgi:hypothetical protein